MEREHDVLVVGCGSAGLSAALAAAQEGADVGVLERSPKAVRGGNSRYTEAYLRLKSETEISDDFEERLSGNSGGYVDPSFWQETLKSYDAWPPIVRAHSFTDPELIMTFASGVPDTMAWLKTFGLRFEMEGTGFITKSVPRMAPVGGGEAIVETLAQAAEKKGVNFYYETGAQRLNLNRKGEITGVHAWSSSTGLVDFKAKAVVLASGGFGGNIEMLTKYLGSEAYLLRTIAPGGMYNKGEGIQMALDIGAAPAGQYGAFHAEPIDPRSSRPEAAIFAFPYGILANQEGKRFIDEASDLVDLIYDVPVTRTILKQPKGIAYFIYDSKIQDVPNYKKAIRTDQAPIEAKSIEDLASKLGIKPAALKSTITSFNEAVQPGEFGPLVLDGKHTEGIEPPKSNWARTIDKPPFMAYPIICAMVFTFGGLKVTPKAQVLNQDGFAIPGLYAAGEVIGMYYHFYPGSTSVLRGLVFGRIAGENAVKYLQ